MLRPRMVLAFALVVAPMVGSCRSAGGPAPGASARAVSSLDAGPASSPPAAASYLTDPGVAGVVGGPVADRLALDILATLRARGDAAEPESSLAALASWYYRQVAAGMSPSSPQSEAAAARLGFVGALHAASVFPLDAPGRADREWREVLGELAHNMPVNRFGVWLSPDDRTAVVVFATVEMTLEPFPRRLPRGGTVRLVGRIADRFVRGGVYLTLPGGAVQETPVAGRSVDATLRLGAPGIYRLEIMGDGPSGPVVLGNVPLYVDVPEPTPGRQAEGTPAGGAAGAAERMMTLLNEARRAAGAPPLGFDADLARVALAYSEEMVAGHFFGHVSPTTGTVVDRLRRAGIAALIVGENVSQGDSAEAAHQGLMDSPGHRANMLDRRFTHAGIGVAPTGSEPPLLATIVFARRPAPERLTAPDLLAEVASLRRAHHVAVAAVDPVLQAAAEAGLLATEPGGGEASKDTIMNAAGAALLREDRRLGIKRSGGCAEWIEILERDDLKEVGLLVSPGVKKIGLAAGLRATGRPRPLGVLILVESNGCR